MVGYTLRQERERQELSINDIEQGTSIRAVYIESIENGEYDKLPGNVYTKGFIKNYAKFLGMDVDAVVKEFTADIAELSGEETPETPKETSEPAQTKKAELKIVKNEKPAKPVKPVKPVKPDKTEIKKVTTSVVEDGKNSSNMLVVAAVVLIAALAGFAWSFLTNSDGDVAKVNPPVQQTQSVEPQPTEHDNQTTVASANPAPKTDGVEIQARFNDACWTLVTVDGAVVQEGTIEGGQTISWEGKDNITFRFGNAGAVELFQDGKSLGVQGAIGDIVDKTFNKQ